MAAIEFSKGDGIHHTFSMPADAWEAGGTLFFAAKSIIDDVVTDDTALIKIDWDDSVVTDVTIDGVAYKQYACYFPPSATNNIASNGDDSAEYLAEFQWVPAGGDPVSFPPKDPKLRCIVYFDVNRRVT